MDKQNIEEVSRSLTQDEINNKKKTKKMRKR